MLLGKATLFSVFPVYLLHLCGMKNHQKVSLTRKIRQSFFNWGREILARWGGKHGSEMLLKSIKCIIFIILKLITISL